MAQRSSVAVVLAAGEGTRMKSALPKVLHKVGGLPMLAHVVGTAAAAVDRIALVVRTGPTGDQVAAAATAMLPGVQVYRQNLDNAEERGTGKAVLAARASLAGADDVVVLLGDAPMLNGHTIGRAREKLAEGDDVVVVGFRADDPTGYGRLVMGQGDRLLEIVEHKAATAAQRTVNFVNSGIIAFRGKGLPDLLSRIARPKDRDEYWLTDAIALVVAGGGRAVAIGAPADEVAGVNDRIQLSHAEGVFQRRMREAAMRDGVTMVAPSTVWFQHDTRLGRDVTIEPNVFFGPGVTVADNVTIRADCHIEGATIASGAIIGPFARLRPGAVIGPDVHIGNFVEIKNATIDQGAKLNHLTYMGDAHVGARANVGAGTIACNYDGVDKHRTEIGAGAFIGSNSALVAPVTVGAGAYVASGSVVTHDVPPDALAVARGKQVDKPGWAKNFREMKARGRKETATGRG